MVVLWDQIQRTIIDQSKIDLSDLSTHFHWHPKRRHFKRCKALETRILSDPIHHLHDDPSKPQSCRPTDHTNIQ